ncbi:MAG: LicD family protein [Bacteroidales bacterium]|nr:LicD family protein [Bacteroidales bacterium]
MEYKVDISKNKSIAFNQLSEVLNVIDSVGIDYWIEYGTLLGAVRDKTIIPWDSEFDMGIWYSDYEKNKEFLLNKFNELGFKIDFSSKDRVKLIHKTSEIGAYTIDIHTYHVLEDIAFVSCSRFKKSFYNKFIYRTYKSFRFYDDSSKPVYYMARIVKMLMTEFESIPNEFIFKHGKYNFAESFQLLVENKVLDNDKRYLNKIGVMGRFGLKVVGVIPKGLRSIIFRCLKNKVDSFGFTNEMQAIPVHYYKNLTKIAFGPLYVSCPKDYLDYITMIYGTDWNVSKPHWNSTAERVKKRI